MPSIDWSTPFLQVFPEIEERDWRRLILAQLDKRHGIIGMDVLKEFNVEGILFDYPRESVILWRSKLEDERFSADKYLCHDE
jgi:hypothetical protein